MAHILLRHRDIENIHRYDIYIRNGGYEVLKKAKNEHTHDKKQNNIKTNKKKGKGKKELKTKVKRRCIHKEHGKK
jgi:NADH:ubiquinone oxidoreductase subunit F (NADH-binding)